MKRERSSDGELLRYALKYAGWGLRVLPLHAVREGACTCLKARCYSQGKHPRTPNGVKNATSDRAQIQRWWEMWPDANIGIATGVSGERGLYVIDVDSSKGASLDSLQDCNLPDLLRSRIAQTGSGGSHIYLKCSEPLPNTTNRLGPFIDTRGENGYVVAPPSRNIHGPYVWSADLNRIQPMPPELLAKLKMDKTSFTIYSPKKAEKTNEISLDARLPTTQAAASAPNVQPAAPAGAVPQASGPDRPGQTPRALSLSPQAEGTPKTSQAPLQARKPGETRAAWVGPLPWQQRQDGVYQLSVEEHQIYLTPHSFLPDLYTALARLAPDFGDECWFNNAPLIWAQTCVETRMRSILTES